MEIVVVMIGHIPLLEKEGWPRHQQNGPIPKRRGRGGHSATTEEPPAPDTLTVPRSFPVTNW